MSLSVNTQALSLNIANYLNNKQAKLTDAEDAAPAPLTMPNAADDANAVLKTDTYESSFVSLTATIQSSVENMVSAMARIQNEGFAQQSVEQLKEQFLQNPLAAMQAQANLTPQSVMALLK